MAFERERDELEIVAAVQRQLDDPLVVDDGADGGVLGLELNGVGLDGDGFGDLADGEREIETDDLLHAELHVLGLVAFEPGLLDLDAVRPGRQRRQRVIAGFGGHGVPGSVGAHVGGGNGGLRRGGAGCVGDSPGDFAESLRKHGQRERGHKDSAQQM